LLHTEVADALQTKQEERASVKHLLSKTPLGEQQLQLQQEQKANGSLPASTSLSPSSSSLFLFPTTHNVTHLSGYDRSPPPLSLVKEQQHFHHPSHQYEQHPYCQPLNSKNTNNQLLLLKNSDQEKDEQHQLNESLIPHQNFDLHDIPEENDPFSSSYPLNDTIVENNNNKTDNQSHLFTSTRRLPSSTSYQQTTNKNIFPLLSPNKNNNNNPLPLTLDSISDQSSTVSTSGLITDLQRQADVCQLNNMSSLRNTSNLSSGAITSHPYDQRISDQGNKYIIQLKTDEYQENDFTIIPRYTSNQLIIDAKHREEDHCGGYIHRELHKIFNIPKHIDLDRRTHSYNNQTQELTIEIPYSQTISTTNENKTNSTFISPGRNTTDSSTYSDRNILPTRSDYHNDSNNTSGIGTTATDSILTRSLNTGVVPTYEKSIANSKSFDFDGFHRSVFRPQIVRTTTNDVNTNEKKLIMSLDLSDYQAEDIKVSVKDRELIVKAERNVETGTRKSRSSFYQSTSLPPQTDIEHLQSNYIDGKLTIEAPYLEQNNSDRKIQTTTSNNQGTNW
jgi:HSP20 family molecular chaperone IbpA